MTRPVIEYSPLRTQQRHGWRVDQLERRPPVPYNTQWASVDFSGSGGSTGDWVYCDIDIMITNAPDLFGINIGANGAEGVELLVDDIWVRMWSGFDVEVNQSGLTGSYDGLQWNDFFAYYARISNEVTHGWRTTAGFHGSSDTIRFASYSNLDLERVGGAGPVNSSPQNVIEFGFAQNTGHNANLNGGAMFEVLTQDPALITFLT